MKVRALQSIFRSYTVDTLLWITDRRQNGKLPRSAFIFFFLRMKEEVQRRGQWISWSETRIFSICCTVRTAFTHSLRHYGHGLIPERNSRTGTQSVLDYPLSPFLYRPEKLTFFLQLEGPLLYSMAFSKQWKAMRLLWKWIALSWLTLSKGWRRRKSFLPLALLSPSNSHKGLRRLLSSPSQ